MAVDIEKWIKRATPDYFSMFINAWLPFNAWYMDLFYDESIHRTTDKDIISHIRNSDNRYKTKILALLRGDNDESRKFKALLGGLHVALESDPIPNNDHRIGFSRMCISTPAGNIFQNVQSFGSYTYKCLYDRSRPRGTKRVVCEVINKKNSHTKYLVEQNEWDELEFVKLPDYLSIGEQTIRDKLLEYYMEINPYKPENIVCLAERRPDGTFVKPKRSIEINSSAGLYFVDDCDKVAQVLIQLLYELRCKLFHGEMAPLECFQDTYKYAFEIQLMLIKTLV